MSRNTATNSHTAAAPIGKTASNYGTSRRSRHLATEPFRKTAKRLASILITALLPTLLVACSDSSSTGSGANTKAPTPPATEETLLLQPPPAWLRIEEQSSEAFRLAEFIPAGQDKDDWEDRIFVEANALQPLPDPIRFLETMGDALTQECEGSNHVNIHSGEENGYPTSVRLLICNNNKESARGEVTLIKAIQGSDFFYVISRARRSTVLETSRSPLTQKEMAEWTLYMRSIKLCDSRSEEHTCPQTAL